MSSAFFEKFFFRHHYNKDDATAGMAKRMLQTTQDIKKLSFLRFFRNRLLLKIPSFDCFFASYSIHASFRYWNVCLILVSTWQLLFPDASRSFPMCLKHLNFRMQRRWKTQTWMCGLARKLCIDQVPKAIKLGKYFVWEGLNFLALLSKLFSFLNKYP